MCYSRRKCENDYVLGKRGVENQSRPGSGADEWIHIKYKSYKSVSIFRAVRLKPLDVDMRNTR